MSNDLNIPEGEILGHPKGLFLLFATEMWERFSYYGMRALLVLTMVAATEAANPGFGWTNSQALELYGIYTGFSYFTPLVGGWLADNFLGQRRAVVMGAIIMSAGQFILSASVAKDLTMFYIGLAVLISGNGLFKANISTMVGELYRPGDARRDAAFSIFYMGVNLGAFLAPLVCSYFGEKVAWKYGYFAAGCGMTLSALIQIFLAPRFIGDLGKQPSAQRSKALAGGVKNPLTSVERDRLRVVFMLFVFVVLFWAAFEQAGGLMNLYASEKTDRMLGSFEIPAGWFQSVNSMFIILLAPVFGMLWVGLAKRGKAMPTPIKMVMGLLFTGIGFVAMVAAVFDQGAHGKANMIWLILAYLFHTMGELCISPVGLSMVTKLAPLRLASLMMGCWFLTNSVANYLAGKIGVFAEQAGELTVFAGLAGTLAAFAVILWFLSGKVVDWMHGAEAITENPPLQVEPSGAA
ncbi:MAG: peptide MFS transporter [Burkholderiaceae bacterium]|nr:peptide MFS transporter [Burkholderiaceae bacterium]